MVKNAQLAAMDEIDRKFNSMPMTWAQVWTSAMNMIQKGSAPFLTVVSWLANNMSIIGPLLLGLGAALAVYASFTYGAAAAQWVLNAATADESGRAHDDWSHRLDCSPVRRRGSV